LLRRHDAPPLRGGAFVADGDKTLIRYAAQRQQRRTPGPGVAAVVSVSAADLLVTAKGGWLQGGVLSWYAF
ncbi:hypothetical protein ACFRR6_02180, partial [Streptomyces sp. NPDC056891]|uniref:hypothetical protein n=1 Tax=Streptomyces sp. NPDC056891 TaxID=3345961 RepID=UPI00368EE6A3